MGKPSCYNRPPFKGSLLAQDGWKTDLLDSSLRHAQMKLIQHTMSKDCRQWGELGEAKLHQWDCDGCRWKPLSPQTE